MPEQNESVTYREECGSAYAALRSNYERLCVQVSAIIHAELDQAEIKVAGIHHRAKTIESFLDKIERKHYRDPLDEIEDLAGIRIVCLYDDDRLKIAEICRKNFDLVSCEDRGRELGADRMGYIGTHLIIRMGDEYRGGVYQDITSLKCEIQIRTVVQDAWAMISHGLVYKNEEDVPENLRRNLNHAAALLEIAQATFDEIKRKRLAYIQDIDRNQREDAPTFISRPIDFDTLTAYVRWKFPGEQPDDRLTAMVMEDIDRNRFSSLLDIDRVVDRARPAVEAYRKEVPELFGNGTDFLTKSLGFGDPDFRRKHRFGPTTRQAFPRLEHLVEPDAKR